LAARDGDAAQPGFVCLGTIGAGAHEAVLPRAGDLAGNLREGFEEVVVGGFGGVVVEGGEGGDAGEGAGVARRRVGDVGAEGEVEEDCAVAVWRGLALART
ncbi:hypothetical protein V493_07611, partial [Pseudogymnoascus sp. VKM F-4281 (FW-2241)]